MAKQIDLASSWPWFLDILDSDPADARAGFVLFLQATLELWRPRFFSKLDAEGRHRVTQTLVIKCLANNFRNLRRYKNEGTKFAAWLSRVIEREAIDRLRQQQVYEPLPLDPEPSPELPPDIQAMLQELTELMDRYMKLYLTDEEQLAVKLWAKGCKPQEILRLTQWTHIDNKQLSDMIRKAVQKLSEAFRRDGIDLSGLDDLFPSAQVGG